MTLRLEALLFATLYVVSANCFAQEPVKPTSVLVKLLDYKTGKPLRHRHLQLTVSTDKGSRYLLAKTDNYGIADFNFGDITPPAFWVVTLDDLPCTYPEEFPSSDVLKEGANGSFYDLDICTPHVSSQEKAHPREIVFYAHKRNFWQRYKDDIER